MIELFNEQREAGVYEIELNNSNPASGTYIYKIFATGGAEKFWHQEDDPIEVIFFILPIKFGRENYYLFLIERNKKE